MVAGGFLPCCFFVSLAAEKLPFVGYYFFHNSTNVSSASFSSSCFCWCCCPFDSPRPLTQTHKLHSDGDDVRRRQRIREKKNSKCIKATAPVSDGLRRRSMVVDFQHKFRGQFRVRLCTLLAFVDGNFCVLILLMREGNFNFKVAAAGLKIFVSLSIYFSDGLVPLSSTLLAG